jgi:cytochrome b pre-mRNA-processing protein 6
MMKPASDPNHYDRLAKEIEEVPDRGFWGRLMKRLGGMVRMK